jgi:hypothetical protein
MEGLIDLRVCDIELELAKTATTDLPPFAKSVRSPLT